MGSCDGGELNGSFDGSGTSMNDELVLTRYTKAQGSQRMGDKPYLEPLGSTCVLIHIIVLRGWAIGAFTQRH